MPIGEWSDKESALLCSTCRHSFLLFFSCHSNFPVFALAINFLGFTGLCFIKFVSKLPILGEYEIYRKGILRDKWTKQEGN